MQTLTFKLQLQATPEKIWHCLWEQENYKQWTNVFCKGSYYKTDSFTQGNTIHLLTPNGDGMFSIIDQLIPNHLLVFKHLGELKNFEEQPLDENTQNWTNALESYKLIPNQNGVELIVKVQTLEEYVPWMNKSFPLALQALQQLTQLE